MEFVRPLSAARQLVFGHERGQKLRSTLPPAIADMAGNDRHLAPALKAIPGGEIRHHKLKCERRYIKKGVTF